MLENIDTSVITDAMIGGGVVAAILALGALAFLLVAGLYVYKSFAWMTIAQRMKYKNAWLAWIPFADVAMMLQLGGFHWAWIFLLFIPILGWIAVFVMFIIANWRIFEKFKYPGWLSLSLLFSTIGTIIYFIVVGFVAWERKSSTRKVVRKKTASKKKVARKKVTRKKATRRKR